MIIPESAAHGGEEELFHLPTVVDELDELATTATGAPRYLDDAQRDALRRTGRFAVPSGICKGLEHVWEIHAFVLSGTDYLADNLLNTLAWCYAVIVLDGPRRLCSSKDYLFSVPGALRMIPRALVALADVLIGVPRVVSKFENDTRALHLGAQAARACGAARAVALAATGGA